MPAPARVTAASVAWICVERLTASSCSRLLSVSDSVWARNSQVARTGADGT